MCTELRVGVSELDDKIVEFKILRYGQGAPATAPSDFSHFEQPATLDASRELLFAQCVTLVQNLAY